jgi:hypothetical protein
MAVTTNRTVVGVFHDADRARDAVRDLRNAGFTEDQIGVISRHTDRGGDYVEEGSKAAAGAATGAAAGAGIAALWSLGISFGVLPVIGPILAAGPIAAALISAAGGAAAGGLVGALIGMGLPEEEAQYYEGEFQSGRTLVTVNAGARYGEAWSILQRHGAYSRETAAGTPNYTGTVTSTHERSART